MMHEQAMADAVAAIADRHIDTKRAALREQIALRLLADNGTVSTDDVDAQLEREWAPPDARTLANVVAAKAAAAVEFCQRQVTWETELGERAQCKVAKLEAQLEAARADLAAAEASTAVEDAEQHLREAEALAEYAARAGDPSAAPAGTYTTAGAGVATGKGGA